MLWQGAWFKDHSCQPKFTSLRKPSLHGLQKADLDGSGRPSSNIRNHSALHAAFGEQSVTPEKGSTQQKGAPWRFQSETRRRQFQDLDSDVDESPVRNGNRRASSRTPSPSQTWDVWEQKTPDQHPSWQEKGSEQTSGRGQGGRHTRQRDAGLRSQGLAPRQDQEAGRKAKPQNGSEEDEEGFWNIPPAGRQQERNNLGDASRQSTENLRGSQRRSLPVSRSPLPSDHQTNGSSPSRSPIDTWNAVPREPEAIVKQSRRSGPTRNEARRPSQSSYTSSPAQGIPRRTYRRSSREQTTGNEGTEPWRQMQSGQQAAEVDRKARVRLNIACNKLMLTFFEEFSAEEQAAERMADRQEILHTFLCKLEDTLLGSENSMDAINVATCIQKTAIACCSTAPVGEVLTTAQNLFRDSISLCLKLEGTFKLNAITVVLGALAKLSQANSRLIPTAGSHEAHDVQMLLEGFAARALNRISEPPAPEAHQLSLLVWAYSRLSLDPLDGKLFDLVEQTAEPLISRFEAQNVSNFLLAFATLDKPLSEGLMEKLARQAILKMPHATPQGIGNLLWAFGKLTNTSPLGGDLFRSALSRAAEIIGDFVPQNVANLFWAADKFQHPLSPRMLDRLAIAALKRVRGASTITLANLLTSYSKMEGVTGREPLFMSCIEEVDRKLEQCNGHSLSNLIWTLGSVRIELPVAIISRLNEAWAERSLAVLDSMWGRHAGWGQNVSNTLWGYSQLRLDPLQGRYFQTVLSRLTSDNLSVMLPMHTNSILMAAANMQRMSFSPEFLKHGLNQIIAKGGIQEICNTMWSLSTLGLMRRPIMKSLVQQLISLTNRQPLQKASARQLLMAYTILQGSSDQGDLVPEWLTEQCTAVLQDQTREPVISKFHAEVSAALESIGIPHAIEFSSPDGLLSIDIVARCGDGKPLAVEVDGEEHFTRLQPHRPLGHTVIRNKLIAAMGFRGVGVPFYDWKSLTRPSEKATYIAARLAKWGISPS